MQDILDWGDAEIADDISEAPEAYGVEGWLGEQLDVDDVLDLADVLRDALHEDYADAAPEEMEDALANVLDSLTPAESFNFAKALRQIETGAGQALADPAVARIAATALPLAGAAVGTAFGGPVGTGIGSGLGNAAAKAISGARPTAPTAPGLTRPTVSPAAPIAAGSPAAAKALVLTQQPDVLKSLLALAFGDHGRKSVNGVPVGAVMNLLSTVLGQAAADADELLRTSQEPAGYLLSGEGAYRFDPATPADRADGLYEALLDAENEDLAEAVGEW